MLARGLTKTSDARLFVGRSLRRVVSVPSSRRNRHIWLWWNMGKGLFFFVESANRPQNEVSKRSLKGTPARCIADSAKRLGRMRGRNRPTDTSASIKFQCRSQANSLADPLGFLTTFLYRSQAKSGWPPSSSVIVVTVSSKYFTLID
jgi:hypothetical protein